MEQSNEGLIGRYATSVSSNWISLGHLFKRQTGIRRCSACLSLFACLFLSIAVPSKANEDGELQESQATYLRPITSFELNLGVGLVANEGVEYEDEESFFNQNKGGAAGNPAIFSQLSLANSYEVYSLRYDVFTNPGFVQQAFVASAICVFSIGILCGYAPDEFTTFSDVSLMYGRRSVSDHSEKIYSVGVGVLDAYYEDDNETLFDTTGLVLDFTHRQRSSATSQDSGGALGYYCHANINDVDSYITCGIEIGLIYGFD